jgi:hypothetical protein
MISHFRLQGIESLHFLAGGRGYGGGARHFGQRQCA